MCCPRGLSKCTKKGQIANRCSSCSSGVLVSGWGWKREGEKSRKKRTKGSPLLTWLSSVSAAILSFGSIVPFSAWMIRLRSMSAGGSFGPGASQQAGLQPGCLLGSLGPLRHRGPPHPHPLPLPPPPAATCCATLTPRPLSSLLPPHNSLSIHLLRQPVGGGRGSSHSFTAASSPGVLY